MTGLVTIDAVFPYARDRLHYPEDIEAGLSGHNVEEVYFWGTETPDIFIDIEDVMDAKIESLRAHKSQLSDWGQGDNPTTFDDMVRKMSRRTSSQHKLSFEYAESFRRFGIRRAWEDT